MVRNEFCNEICSFTLVMEREGPKTHLRYESLVHSKWVYNEIKLFVHSLLQFDTLIVTSQSITFKKKKKN
jgi:hypothetical protein